MTKEVVVGNLGIGGDNPVRVQSMTNTKTSDINATVKQILELHEAGSELVRVTVKNEEDAKAIPEIRKQIGNIPLIGDFHYNGHVLLTKYPECAQALDKYRINPGNVSDENFRTMIHIAKEYDKPIRIGVNAGSIDPKVMERSSDICEAMVVSAIESAKTTERLGHDKIILSAKVSRVPELIKVYRDLAEKTDYPLHLGLTEAGLGNKGIISSTAGISVLLHEGIGNTIRVSLTPSPNTSRTEEVKVAQHILQANGIRRFMPTVTSCPGCGRTKSTLFQEIAQDISRFVEEKTPAWKKSGHKVENLTIAVMGCIVNGPGESKHANIGLSLPGDHEDPEALVYIDGKLTDKLHENISERFKQMIEDYVVMKNEKL